MIVTSAIEKNTECSICLDPLQNNLAQISMCKHIFHRTCIETWIGLNHPTCPLCQTSITDTNRIVTVISSASLEGFLASLGINEKDFLIKPVKIIKCTVAHY